MHVKTIFRLQFNREKYMGERINGNIRIQNVDNYFESLPKLTLKTNLTCFEIPIFVYDRYLMFSIVKNEEELRKKSINKFGFVQNLKEENDLGYVLVNSTRKVQIVLHNINPVNVSQF
jgi:hypothetical protein